MKILISIVAYSRYDCLNLLLSTLSSVTGKTSNTYDILGSIDFSTNQYELVDLFDSFDWSYGNKKLKLHNKNIGLIRNVYYSADYAINHNYDFVVVLEDDLLVSSNFIDYIDSIISFHPSHNDKIAGYSLYSPRCNETSYKSFFPLTKCDNFFMQLPSSWGQLWSFDQWQNFRNWTKTIDSYSNLEKKFSMQIPSNIKRWSNKSWKKIFLLFLIENDLYFFYPLFSITSNSGSTGVHSKSDTHLRTLLSYKKEFKYSSFNNCSVYDCFMDPKFDTIKNFITNFSIANNLEFNLTGEKILLANILEVSYLPKSNVIASFNEKFLEIPLNINKSNIGNKLYISNGKYNRNLKNIFRFVFFNNLKFSFLGFLRRFIFHLLK